MTIRLPSLLHFPLHIRPSFPFSFLFVLDTHIHCKTRGYQEYKKGKGEVYQVQTSFEQHYNYTYNNKLIPRKRGEGDSSITDVQKYCQLGIWKKPPPFSKKNTHTHTHIQQPRTTAQNGNNNVLHAHEPLLRSRSGTRPKPRLRIQYLTRHRHRRTARKLLPLSPQHELYARHALLHPSSHGVLFWCVGRVCQVLW